jgi:hypothetical protein
VRTAPPRSRTIAASASGSAIEPPRGVVHENACRPDVIESGRRPVPGWSTQAMVMSESHRKNARTCSSAKRSRTVSSALE